MSNTATTAVRDPALAETLGTVLEAPGARPTPPGALSAAMTFLWRAMLKIRHVPEQLSDVLASFLLLFVFGFAFSWVWTLMGLIVRTPQAMLGLSMGLIFPLTFVSNVFVAPTTMPAWLEAFVDVNPISVLVTAIRGLMDGTATTGQIGAVLLISAAMIAVFGPLTMHRYNADR